MPDTNCILVVEDERDMRHILEYNLGQQGYRVTTAGTGKEMRAALQGDPPDLVLLDLRLPDAFGLDLLRDLRRAGPTSALPVIIVSASGEEETVVKGLNLGADDYVTKPFRLHELLARVASVLRRRPPDAPAPAVLQVGEIVVDAARRASRVKERPIDLTRTEFDLLAHFLRHPGRVFTRQQLCEQALGAGGNVQERTIDAHMRTIRRKLGTAGRCLVTVWGIGYQLTSAPESPPP